MSGESQLPQPPKNVVVDTAALPSSSSSSVWDRVSKWVSENKALVYTIAGVAVVVTSAGVVYYLSDSGRTGQAAPSADKKKSKNQKRKEKKKADEEKKAKTPSAEDGMSAPCASLIASQSQADAVTEKPAKKAEEPEELPEVDEATVGELSEDVGSAAS
jgi:import receptor subunit TOM70